MRRLVLAAAIVSQSACGATQSSPQIMVRASAPPSSAASNSPAEANDNDALHFDVALYKELARDGGNQFVSPFSVATAFTLLYPGARGATAEEIARAFGFDSTASIAVARSRELARTLQAGEELRIANAVWPDREFALAPPYLRMVRDELGGMVEAVDFQQQSEVARQRINSWTAQETRDRIKDLVPPGILDWRTRLVLTNAVYFKADWEHPFLRRATETGYFRREGDGKAAARFMRDGMKVSYIEDDTFQAAQFDYRGEQFALAVFLPRESSSLRAFEQRMTAARLRDWLNGLSVAKESYVQVRPRVHIEGAYHLIPALRATGLRLVFSRGADLRGLTDSRGDDLYVSHCVHKTFLDINEEGTEAAAATALEVQVVSARVSRKRIAFTADRPFFIALFHKPTRTILFMGRVADVTVP